MLFGKSFTSSCPPEACCTRFAASALCTFMGWVGVWSFASLSVNWAASPGQRRMPMEPRVPAAAPGAPMSGPDTGAYTTLTYTPDPDDGVAWTGQFARDERDLGRITVVTQHHYTGGDPGATTAEQAIGNMLSPEWVTGTAIGTQPAGTGVHHRGDTRRNPPDPGKPRSRFHCPLDAT